MSYEKYIKYKSKYLNLKAAIHNTQIQSGGGYDNNDSDEFIQTLGSTPNSEIFNNNLVGGSRNTDKQSSSEVSNKSKDLSKSKSDFEKSIPDLITK